jgi:hypothetical protein
MFPIDILHFFIKVLLLGIFSVHTPGYKSDLNCSFNQFTWVVTHPVRGIKGSDLLGFDSTAVKNRIKGKNTAIGEGGC